MSDIIKGSRVMRDFNRYSPRVERGEVVIDPVKDPLTNQLKAYVKWDNNTSHAYECYLGILILEEEGDKKLSLLEVEFRQAQQEVMVKMNEATKILREANSIAKTVRHDVKDLLALYPAFEDELQSAGWYSSSWNC